MDAPSDLVCNPTIGDVINLLNTVPNSKKVMVRDGRNEMSEGGTVRVLIEQLEPLDKELQFVLSYDDGWIAPVEAVCIYLDAVECWTCYEYDPEQE